MRGYASVLSALFGELAILDGAKHDLLSLAATGGSAQSSQSQGAWHKAVAGDVLAWTHLRSESDPF